MHKIFTRTSPTLVMVITLKAPVHLHIRRTAFHPDVLGHLIHTREFVLSATVAEKLLHSQSHGSTRHHCIIPWSLM
ncbi:hypothetical protein SeMB42_g02509 [Synchytrium endobioticum]|uniref:Uncharacterized protein n=1 Tax=Synchytrium endobioticum TaxID=286115 RepID=A0A507DDE1_9FUNG|nr:hypothetical protein SeMB42_g02509 [Synchytrium endobioticum]